MINMIILFHRNMFLIKSVVLYFCLVPFHSFENNFFPLLLIKQSTFMWHFDK